MCMRNQWELHYESVRVVDAIEWACVLVAVTFKMTERVEQWICIKVSIKLEHSSVETIQMIQRPAAMGYCDWQLHHDNAPTHTSHLVQRFLVKHQITQVTQPLYSPELVPFDFSLFPKLNSPLKGKTFQTVNENWGKYYGVADGDSNKGFCRVFWTVEETLGELCEVSRYLLLNRLRYHCPMYNVSCIFNKCVYFS